METTLLSKILFIVMVTLTFDLMTPKYIGFFPFHRGIMWPSLVKIRYTELKLLCGNLCGCPPARHTLSHNTTLLEMGILKPLNKMSRFIIHVFTCYSYFCKTENIFQNIIKTKQINCSFVLKHGEDSRYFMFFLVEK